MIDHDEMDYYEYPSYQKIRETRVQSARKDYNCWAGHKIPKGSPYHYLVAIYDGQFTTQRDCGCHGHGG